MSHRAIIAERQRNNRYNIYHSQNGAERIQLLDELRDSLNVHGRVDWESLTGTTQSEFARQMSSTGGSKCTVQSNVSDNIVEPCPLAVNVPEDQLLNRSDLLQYEVLYVVNDGTVDAYWLAWAYPDVIRPWHNHFQAKVYKSGAVPEDPDEMVRFFEDGEPVRTISEFEQGWLADDFVREVVRECHRWLYEVRLLTMKEAAEVECIEVDQVPNCLYMQEHFLVFHSDVNERLVSPSPSFVIPIRIESPPNASSKRISEAAARTRFSIGAGLNAVDEPSKDEIRQAHADAVMEIVEGHVDRVAPEFIPGGLGELIKVYQQTGDWHGFVEAGKS